MPIEANLIKHSKSAYSGQEIYGFELELPRTVLAELHTHRGEVIFNSQSSRAVPVKKYIDEIEKNPFYPIHWGKKQSGMQAYEENDSLIPWLNDINKPDEITYHSREDFYKAAMYNAFTRAYAMDVAGYHKQICNRWIENFSYIRIVLTATNLSNLFHQRIHKSAEPHIRDLAVKMYSAIRDSVPDILNEDEWHLPYVATKRNEEGILEYFRMGDTEYENPLSLKEAQDISVACSGQVSYRKMDDSPEKVRKVMSMLKQEGEPTHYSPYCHQATPMKNYHLSQGLPEQLGISHVMRNGDFHSGQLKHWVQLRKTFLDEYCSVFDDETFETRLKTF